MTGQNPWQVKRTHRGVLAIAAVVASLSGSVVRAGGIGLYEVDSVDVSLAAAGYAARAQDPSTVFTNPAGMSRLEDAQVMTNATPLYGSSYFDSGSGTTTAGNDGGDAIGWVPLGGLFLTVPLTESVTVGFGTFSYFGLGLSYDNDWVGRYYVQENQLQGLTLMPSISLKLNEQWSVGAGLNAMYGTMMDQVAVNNVLPGASDGQLKFQDTDWGFGGEAGILWQPAKDTRFGLTYLSPVDLSFKDSPRLTNIGPGLSELLARREFQSIKIDMTVPQQVMFSGYHDLNDQWAIMGNVGWQNWSEFGKADISINSATSPSATTSLGYNDTWHVALGTQYRPNQTWTFSTGVAYDSSMMDDGNRSPSLPVGATWRWGIGAQYALTRDLTLGMAYELAYSGDPSVDVFRGPLAGRLDGSYPNTAVSFFSVSLLWKI